jgi:hypothetical protein
MAGLSSCVRRPRGGKDNSTLGRRCGVLGERTTRLHAATLAGRFENSDRCPSDLVGELHDVVLQ